MYCIFVRSRQPPRLFLRTISPSRDFSDQGIRLCAGTQIYRFLRPFAWIDIEVRSEIFQRHCYRAGEQSIFAYLRQPSASYHPRLNVSSIIRHSNIILHKLNLRPVQKYSFSYFFLSIPRRTPRTGGKRVGKGKRSCRKSIKRSCNNSVNSIDFCCLTV